MSRPAKGIQKNRRLHSYICDLDILVEFAQTPDLFKFMDLEDHLQTLLGVKVELVSRKALKGSIGRRILSEVVSL